MRNTTLTLALTALAIGSHLSKANSSEETEYGSLRLLDWKPESQMVAPETKVETPAFPVIDIHNHLRNQDQLEAYLSEMDKARVSYCVSLDGYSKNDFYIDHLKRCREVSGDRFIVFFRPDWDRFNEPRFVEEEVAKLEDAVKRGARGLKIHKALGLTLKDESGQVVAVDDPRLDPLWSKCAELNIPVMIHVSDPKAFFEPIDERNERYDELAAHPEWSFYGEEFPEKGEILAQRNRVFERHPDTVFIGAHVANMAENLGLVAMWMERYPNLYIDIDARISELGRQPYSTRDFLIRYQDRVMFGTDTPPSAEAYKVYYRFLETRDEYIDPTKGHHLQGRWMIYGLDLPGATLRKLYYENALKVLGMKGKANE